MADPYSLIINGERVFWRIHTITPFFPLDPTIYDLGVSWPRVSYLVKGVDDQGIGFSLECSARPDEHDPIATTFYHPIEKGGVAAATKD